MNNKDIIEFAVSLIEQCEQGNIPEFVFQDDLNNQIQELEDTAVQELLQKLFHFIEQFSRVQGYVSELGKGNIGIEAPKWNQTISPYKQLQSNLKHLVWQTEQIANGDYSQKIHFLGSFSESFNKLIASLQEKEKIKQQIVKSEEKYRLITENTSDVIWIYNVTNDRFVYISPSVEQLRGFTQEEAMKQTMSESLTPDSVKKLNDALEKFLPLFQATNEQNIEPYIIELQQRCKNGDIIWIEVSAKPRKNFYNEIEIVGVSRNIMQRKLMEAEINKNVSFHKMLSVLFSEFIKSTLDDFDNTIHQMLFRIANFFEADRAYLFHYNQETNELIDAHEYCSNGITPAIDYIKKIKLSEFPWFTKNLLQFNVICYDNVNDLPAEAVSEKNEFLKRNIKSVIRIPLKKQDTLIGFLGLDAVEKKILWKEFDLSYLQIIANTTSEIIQKHNIEKELQKAKEDAEEANTAKTKFFTQLSHEIRTPLNNIIGFTQLLNNTELDETQLQYLSNVNISSQSLLSVINETLDLSKIESGKFELNIQEVHIIRTIEQAIDNVKYLSSQKQIELILNIAADVPHLAHIDEVRLRQVLINLLGNAVKFTHKGHVELSVSFEKDPKQDGIGYFTFTVSDTGIGISSEQKQKLFHAYSQADLSISSKYGGTGLGLAISNKLVNLMGSNIQLQSKLGEGSIFYFTIRASYTRANDYIHKQFSNIQHVIIVDDYEKTRTTLSNMLENMEIECSLASGANDTIELFRKKNKCDVLFIDYRMPIKSGFEIIHEIQTSGNSLNNTNIVLLFDEASNAEIITECKRLGIQHKLMKPVKFEELYKILEDLNKKIQDHPLNSNNMEKQEIQYLDEISPKILIAEDVEINMLLITTLLKKLIPHADIIIANNGTQAIQKFVESNPDIIFMDIQMPEKDGYETTKDIRKLEHETGRHTPVIALTAHAFQHERQQCIDAGMDEYLAKPISIHLLEKMLINYLLHKNYQLPTDNSIDETTQSTLRFDSNALMVVANNDRNTFQKLLTLSISQINDDLNYLKIALHENNTDNIKHYAHKIKGVALNMHCYRLAEYAHIIEKKPEEIKQNIENVYQTMKNEIDFILNSSISI